MTAQLPLPFELRADHQLHSFVPGPNSELCDSLLRLGRRAPARVTADGDMVWVHGSPGMGKTHLLQGVVGALSDRGVAVAYLPARQFPLRQLSAILVGSEQYSLLVIDDVDQWLGVAAAEGELVRLYQERRHAGLDLLLSAKKAPAQYSMALPDWQSRAQGAQVFRLAELSEQEKLEVLIARSVRLGLDLSEPVGTYLLRHGPRGLPQMLAVLARVDRLALAEQRRLTVPLLKKALQDEAAGGVELR